ncbi:MAG: hypothetical protein ACM37W_16245 [Actinomycetota bacterium]
MINPKNFVYSKAAIARMRGVALAMVERVEIWWNCIFVIVKGCRPKFYSKDSFRNHFVDWRKAQSEEIDIFETEGNKYTAINERKHSIYTVEALQDGIRCGCDDYQNQIKFLKKGCCKHGYALLNYLGFDRLSDYIEHHRWCS